MTSRSEALLPIEENVRAYVMTGDRKYLAEKGSIPYPDARRLAELLDDPDDSKYPTDIDSACSNDQQIQFGRRHVHPQRLAGRVE
jgi:hypothetical protein